MKKSRNLPIIIASTISFIIGLGLRPFYRLVQDSSFYNYVDTSFISATEFTAENYDSPIDGYGSWISPKGNMYMGTWTNGHLPYGTLITDRSVYVGELCGLSPHGYGVMYYNNGNIYKGNWRYGNKEGIGLKYNTDGSMFFGYWRAGLFSSQKHTQFKVSDFVYGIDLSFYQNYQEGNNLYWNELALYSDKNGEVYPYTTNNKTFMQPVQFVFIKATQGIRKDPLYLKHIEQARKYQVIVGSYHFFTIGDDIDEQIKKIIKTANWVKGDLPPVLDLECEYYVKGDERPYIKALRKYGVSQMKENALRWLKSIEDYYGVKPIIYTSERWRREFLNDQRFEHYNFWIARYYNVKPADNSKWLFWQRTDAHFPNGYETKGRNGVDVNLFNGTFADFNNYRKAMHQ